MIHELKPKSSGRHFAGRFVPAEDERLQGLGGWRTLIYGWKRLETGGFH